MNKIGSYLIYYLLIKPISLLPFPVLYFVSDFLFIFIYHLFGYRKNLVRKNLTRSFPHLSVEEIKIIEKKFYHHLCDIILETVKTFSITSDEIKERFTYNNPEIIKQFYEKGKSVIGITAHYGNWEWGALSMTMNIPHKTMGIFHPLKNSFFNEIFLSSREQFGLSMIAPKEVKTFFEEHLNTPTLSGFVADQTPSNPNKCHWMTFLNQETPVFIGAEKYAKDYNYPLIYAAINKIKRGYYEVTFEVITENPSEEPIMSITEKHVKLLENQINEKPEYWLWSHNRWKKAKPNDYTPITTF
jgi:Kdo2-lipid IVA lauroyltransferase/acyltransferase